MKLKFQILNATDSAVKFLLHINIDFIFLKDETLASYEIFTQVCPNKFAHLFLPEYPLRFLIVTHLTDITELDINMVHYFRKHSNYRTSSSE